MPRGTEQVVNLDLCAPVPNVLANVPGGLHHGLLAETPLPPARPSGEASWPLLCLHQEFAKAGPEPRPSKKPERTGQIHALGLRPALTSSWSPALGRLKPLGRVAEGWGCPWRALTPKGSAPAGCDCQSLSTGPGWFSGCAWRKGIAPHKGTFPPASGSFRQLLSDSAL